MPLLRFANMTIILLGCYVEMRLSAGWRSGTEAP